MPLILSGSAGLSGNVGNVTKDMLPAGTVLQVVQSTKTDRWSTTSQSFVDVPGLVASITPLSTTSKILVEFNVTLGTYQHGDLRLARTILGGSQTPIAIGDAVGSRTRSSTHHYMYTGPNTSYDSHSDSVKYLDSPNTLLSVTYAVQAATPYSPYWIGINNQYQEGDAAYASTTFSSITLTEIKA